MFHVGQHVLCIKPRPRSAYLQGYGDEIWPVKGIVYTVREICPFPQDDVIALLLAEIRNQPRPYDGGIKEFAFDGDGFRPLSRDQIDQLLVVSRPMLEDA